MKTAISVPDGTFDEVERRAAEMGLSRSEFYARAAQKYLEILDAQSLTAQIDEALGATAPDDDSAAWTIEAGTAFLAEGEHDW